MGTKPATSRYRPEQALPFFINQLSYEASWMQEVKI